MSATRPSLVVPGAVAAAPLIPAIRAGRSTQHSLIVRVLDPVGDPIPEGQRLSTSGRTGRAEATVIS